MQKILVIRFSSIGDIVLTTPVIRCLKKQVKNVEIHYLTKKEFSSILENNPYIDKIHTIEKDLSEVIAALKKEDFDQVIDLHHNLRTFTVKRKLGKPSTSFNKLNFQKLLKVKFKINKLPNVHIVDRYMDAVMHLDVVNDGEGLDYFIPEKDEISVSSLPELHQKGYIGFVIGAAHFTKQLPAGKIVSICKKLNKPIVLLGGKNDVERATKIEKAVGPMIYNACGKYNLNQSASIVKQAQTIISHDTGLMHIAAAFNKKIISVWGNTIPAFGMYPYQKSKEEKINSQKSFIVEVKHLSCRPCSKIGYDKCPKGHFKCMMEIDEEKIVTAC